MREEWEQDVTEYMSIHKHEADGTASLDGDKTINNQEQRTAVVVLVGTVLLG